MLTIRRAAPADHDAIWQVMHPVISAGDTYVFDPQMPRDEAIAYWFQPAGPTRSSPNTTAARSAPTC